MKKLFKWGLIGAAVVYGVGAYIVYGQAKGAGASKPLAIAIRWPLSRLGL